MRDARCELTDSLELLRQPELALHLFAPRRLCPEKNGRFLEMSGPVLNALLEIVHLAFQVLLKLPLCRERMGELSHLDGVERLLEDHP